MQLNQRIQVCLDHFNSIHRQHNFLLEEHVHEHYDRDQVLILEMMLVPLMGQVQIS